MYVKRKHIVLTIALFIILFASLLISIIIITKIKNSFVIATNDIVSEKLTMIKLSNGVSEIVKSVPSIGTWKMTYKCDSQDVKLYWNNDERNIIGKNITDDMKCTITFEEITDGVNVIALYVDNEFVTELNSSRKYTLDHYNCSNGNAVTYNTMDKTITITNLTQMTSCSLYFEEIANPFLGTKIYEDALANNTQFESTAGMFNSVTSVNKEQGLYRGEEDGQTIYYYRGGDYCQNSDTSINTTHLTKSACEGAGLTWRTLNNNIVFGGKCWQIIRTNKDGSVRLIYNGVPSAGTCSATGASTQIGTSAFNAETKTINGVAYNIWTDASAAGYTHGSPEGHTYEEYISPNYNFGFSVAGSMYVGTSITPNTQTGTFTLNGATLVSTQKPNTTTYRYICWDGLPTACTKIFEFTEELTGTSAPYTSTYAKAHAMNWSRSLTEAHANEIDSDIKAYLESWYEDNMLEEYNSYIADAGYCNDREVASGNGYGASGDFKSHERLTGATKVPALTCINKRRDLYTVANVEGNRASMYPVGLMTIDEASYAGGVVNIANNINYYLYTGNLYWTMSPYSFYYNTANIYNWTMYSSGMFGSYSVISGIFGVRPVISLKSNVRTSSGTGSKTSPYIVEER